MGTLRAPALVSTPRRGVLIPGSPTLAGKVPAAIWGSVYWDAAGGAEDRTGTAAALAATAELGAASGTRAGSGAAGELAAVGALDAATGTRAVAGQAVELLAIADLGAALGHRAVAGTVEALVAVAELGLAVGLKDSPPVEVPVVVWGPAALPARRPAPTARSGQCEPLRAVAVLGPAEGYSSASEERALALVLSLLLADG